MRAVGPVHVKATTSDGSAHWVTYLRQFETAAHANHLDGKRETMPHSSGINKQLAAD